MENIFSQVPTVLSSLCTLLCGLFHPFDFYLGKDNRRVHMSVLMHLQPRLIRTRSANVSMVLSIPILGNMA